MTCGVATKLILDYHQFTLKMLAIIGVGGLCMYNQVVFIIYRILCIVGYFSNTFYNDDAAGVRIISADLLICCSIQLVLKGVVFDGSFF